jgi:hypothetical protein
MREASLVGQPDLDGGAELGGAGATPRSASRLYLMWLFSADVEVDVDRVLADDGGEKGPLAVPPALTQLPAVTRVRLMRPVMGESMLVKERSSSADLTLASATFTAAWASRTIDMRGRRRPCRR